MSTAQTSAQIPTAATSEQPWPGLAAFEEGDSDFFKGRDAAISAIARLVIREDLAFLWGYSGLGKTSLLRAGLFPRLREADIFPVYIRLGYDASDPPLVQQCFDAIDRTAAQWGYETPRRDQASTLWEYVRRRDQRFWSPKDRLVTPLLVFDQFEEVFAPGHIRADVIDFFADLSRAITGTTSDEQLGEGEYLFRPGVFKVLLSFREDFVAQVAKFAPLVTNIGHQYYRLESLTFEDGVAVVKEGGGHLIENVDSEAHDALCRLLVDHVANTTGAPAARASATVDPALLSLYCSQLNERRLKLGKKAIDTTLLAAGEASTIIPDFYEACMREVSEDSRSILERHLVLQQSRTRNSIAEETLLAEGLKPAELDLLIRRRILRRDTTRQPRIEFTHDVLVDPAIAAFTRREVTQQRAEEEQQRLEKERKRRENLRLRALLVVLPLTVIAALTSWRAVDLSREQTVRLLVQASQNQLARDPQLSAVFSSWAAGAARSQSQQIQSLAEDALNRAVRAASATEARFDTTGVMVALNATGTQAAVVSDDRLAVHLLKLDDPLAPPQQIPASDGKSVFAMQFLANGNEVLLLNSDASIERVRLTGSRLGFMSTPRAGFAEGQDTNPFGSVRQPNQWALTDAGLIVVSSYTLEYPKFNTSSGPGTMMRHWLSVADAAGDLWTREVPLSTGGGDVVLASKGSRYAVVERDETVTIEELDGATVNRHTFPPSRFTVSPDGAHVIAVPRNESAGQSSREVILWSVVRSDVARVTLPGRDEVLSTSFSPDGAVFAVVQAPGVAQFWSTSSLKPIFPAPLSAIAVRFSPDGRSVLTWNNTSAALWRLDGDDRAISMLGGQDGITDVAFAAGSDRIATLTTSGVLVWTTRRVENAIDTVIATRQSGLRVLALAPDGNALAVGGDNQTVTISLADGVARPTATNGRVSALAYSPDSSRLAVAIATSNPADASASVSRVAVQGPRSETKGRELEIPSGRVMAMAFVRPALLAYLVETGHFAGRVEVADLESGRVVYRECLNSRIMGLSADEGAGRFAFGLFTPGYEAESSPGFSFRTVDARELGGSNYPDSRCDAAPVSSADVPPPPPSASIPPPPPPPLSMMPPVSPSAPSLPVAEEGTQTRLPISVINRDLTAAISRSADGEVNLWPTLDRAAAAVALGETVSAIAITRDGRRFAAGGKNGLVRMFDADRWTNPNPITLQPSGARVEAMAFSNDGGRLAVLGADGRVTLYPLGVDELLDKARPITQARTPTPSECAFLGGACGSDPTSVGSMLRRIIPFRTAR